MEHFSNLYTSMYSVSLQPDTDHSRLGTPGRPLDTGKTRLGLVSLITQLCYVSRRHPALLQRQS